MVNIIYNWLSTVHLIYIQVHKQVKSNNCVTQKLQLFFCFWPCLKFAKQNPLEKFQGNN